MRETAAADKVNILLVDDQPAKLMTYEAILEELGENLLRASSAKEALECLLRNEVAVVLVDVCMPDLDGFELAAMIRQHPRHQRTAIILVSAVLIDDVDRLKGYSSGAMDYLPVPVVPEILRAKVSVFADLYRKTRALEALNRDLERRVSERTAELEAAAARLTASEAMLREADRRKDEFLAVLGHELRNPLAPVRNAARHLKVRGPGEPEFRWNLDVIDRQVDHLTRLIDDLLDVARISRGTLELRRESVTLSAVVDSAIESSRPSIDRQGHHLEVVLPPEAVDLFADPIRLSQVLMNLLNNAAKYTPPGGRIELVAEREAGGVVIRVRDNGVGIPPEKLSTLFQMFVQLDDARGRTDRGLGIGLALARHLVELHGGAIEVESAGPGSGSEFRVRLPVVQAVARPAIARTDTAAQLSPWRILVVDDLRDGAASLALLLRSLGHKVETAFSGNEAIEAADRYRPELVLLDIGMPDMDGFAVCRRIRSQNWGSDMMLVALTGWGQEEDRQRALDAGFDAHLVKPLDHTALLSLLARSDSRARRGAVAG
jgi:signal transduction histidine kinase